MTDGQADKNGGQSCNQHCCRGYLRLTYLCKGEKDWEKVYLLYGVEEDVDPEWIIRRLLQWKVWIANDAIVNVQMGFILSFELWCLSAPLHLGRRPLLGSLYLCCGMGDLPWRPSFVGR